MYIEYRSANVVCEGKIFMLTIVTKHKTMTIMIECISEGNL